MKILVNKVSLNKILDKVSFSIRERDVIALLGSNGAGKSTILNIILGLCKPTSGSVMYDKVNLGTVFQDNVLDNKLSVYKNLLYRIKNKNDLERALNKIENSGININLNYENLSGGQKRIVNYFRVVATKPNCLILDELTAGIDFDMRKSIWSDISSYIKKSACGVVYTTHILEEISHANKVIVIKSGKVTFFDTVEKFYEGMPRYKLVLAEQSKYFKTSKEAVEFLKKENKLNNDFEIKKTTYSDLFANIKGN
ncbi:ABC transporter ATP-binding protein [Lactobacillus sp. ESL0681]|uniref:ATP-binding cassette domain-containing protein n=1 Tax=Lactobacillus sp. ESL0681 TaxID=2983211 RepID=UPI0023F8411E|nr:ABC transporter ATP-binding protein [Lactobacillus sp. ESL0681]WEV40752.1 ABC transporter ATP-binding protein [Lactobacillus sp. ESL0681]